MNTQTLHPTASDRRRWNKEDGQQDDEALALAAAQLGLALNAAIVSGKPLDRVIEIPASCSPVSALTAISDLMGDDKGDQITAEMISIIGALACAQSDSPLVARAAAWVDSVANEFGAYWAEELVKEQAENGNEPVVIPVNFRMEPAYQALPSAEQCAAADEMAGIA